MVNKTKPHSIGLTTRATVARETTLQQLQRATLAHQGLGHTPAFGKGKQAVLSALEHLGYVQIDTIYVVERAHHHTLWARVPNYQKEHLEQLVAARKIFEYWFHAASYLPMKDFRYALPQMLQYKQGKARYYQKLDAKTLTTVYDTIRLDGPQRARDFVSSTKKYGSWWDWKPAKVALGKLLMQGDIMVGGRDGMEKIYDLTERVLPSTLDTRMPTPLEFAEYLVNTYLRAYGVTSVKQITHLRTGKALRQNVEHVLQTMLEAKTITAITLDGIPTLFVLQELLENTCKKPTPAVRLLSPFDNAVIHRERLAQLFSFDFRLECYTPKAKRRYGYFCLPILFGDTFIGRVDCKAHRTKGILEITHLHIEDRQEDIELWLKPLVKAIQQFATFNNCPTTKLLQASPREVAAPLQQALLSLGLSTM